MKKISILLTTLFIALEVKSEDLFTFSYDSFFQIPVFYVAPEKINKNTRLVVVMHGRKRNGKEYRDQWIQKAKELNLFVLVPQFSETSFPGVYSFNYGNVFTENNQSLPSDKHLFSWIDSTWAFRLIFLLKLDSNFGNGNSVISSSLLTTPPTVKGTKHFFEVFSKTS